MSFTGGTTFARKLVDDIRKAINGLVDRRRVTGFEGAKARTVGFGPEKAGETKLAVLRPGIGVGDDVLTIKLNGEEVVLGALRKPGDTENDYVLSEELFDYATKTELAEHWHQPANGNRDGLQIGRASSTVDRGTAVGVAAQAADAATAFGRGALATGYIGLALGWGAQATAQGAIALGYTARADKLDAIAMGWLAKATADRAVAIGDSAEASGTYAVALGYLAKVSGARSWMLGINRSNTSNDAGWLVANDVYLRPSSATTGQTRLHFMTNTGQDKSMRISDDDLVYIGERIVGDIRQFERTNKSIASGGPWSFRSAPVVNAANLIATIYSGAVYDSGYRFSANGYTWAYIFIRNYGWGYMVQEGIV